MNQSECLLLPSHFTYLGQCYPGDHAYITLSNPSNPQPVNFHTNITGVPEPDALGLFVLALATLLMNHRRRAL